MRILKNRIKGLSERLEEIFNPKEAHRKKVDKEYNKFMDALKKSGISTLKVGEAIHQFYPGKKGNKSMPNDMKMAKGQGEMETNENGVKRESNKNRGRFDLIPYEALEELAKWYELGAEKYGDRNWEKGISVKDCTNRMARHSSKACNGWMDEGPFAHYVAVIWNAMAAITGIKRNPYSNDHFHDEYLKKLGLRELILTKNDKAINSEIFNKGVSNLEDLAKVTPLIGYIDPSVVPENGVGDHMPAHSVTALKCSWEHDKARLITDKAYDIKVATLNNRLFISCDFSNEEDLEEFRTNLALMGIETTGGNHDIPTDDQLVKFGGKDKGKKKS